MKILKKILEILLVSLLIFITILIFIAVIFRYIMNTPLIFSFELTSVLFAWMIFLGMVLAEYENTHISFNVLEKYISARVNKMLAMARDVVMIVIYVFIVYYGVKLASNSLIKLTSMDISIKYLYYSYPIGVLLLIFVKIHKIASSLLRRYTS